MVETGTARIDDKHVTKLFREHLVRMSDDQYITSQALQFTRPVNSLRRNDVTVLTQQPDATMLQIRGAGMDDVDPSPRQVEIQHRR